MQSFPSPGSNLTLRHCNIIILQSQAELPAAAQKNKPPLSERSCYFLFAYFTMLAISAAKLSAFFSMPSPRWKRVKPVTLISAPSFLATSAT